jgi:hypothetical protein
VRGVYRRWESVPLRNGSAGVSPLEATLLFGGELAAIILIALAFHSRGRHDGLQEGMTKGKLDGYGSGYTQGRKDADNWWLGVESEADRVRQQIWREEAQP